MSVPARSEEVDASASVPVDLDKQRSRKAASHYYSTRWRDAIPAMFHEQVPRRVLELASEVGRRADNETGHCYRTLASFAKATGQSRRTVQRAIADAVRNDLVRVARSGRERVDVWVQPAPEGKRHWISDVDTVAHQVRQPVQSPADTVAHQTRQPVAVAGHSGASEAPTCPPLSNCSPNFPETPPSTSVRTSAGDDDRGEAGEAVAAMEACGLNGVAELLECAEPERIIASCEWWETQRDAGTGLLAQTIRDGGRAPAAAPIGVEVCTLTADLAAEWESVRAALRQSVGDETFALWLGALHPHGRTAEGWVVGCRAGQVAYMTGRYGRVLEQAAGEPVRLVACADGESFVLEGIDGGQLAKADA